MTHAQAALIHEVREWLQTARHTVLFTGAGMSAESGIQTFRDALTGLWSQFNPMDLATPGAFERQPELVLSWYAGRRAQALSCQPHAGYEAA